MKIGELAVLSGLAASRIRFYEASGLIAKAQRLANGYREYSPQTLQILKIVTTAQQAGFALEEIRHLLPVTGVKSWNREALLSSLRRKIDEIAAMQLRLKQNKRQLLSIIDSIENRPAEIACDANAERLMARLREQSDDHLIPASPGVIRVTRRAAAAS